MNIKKSMPIVTTTKLKEVSEYYVKFFAFKVTFDYPDNFIGMVSTRNEDVEIAFMSPNEGCQSYSGHGLTLCLEVDDVDAECERLTAAGLPIVAPVKDNPWGDRSFISVDPGGVSVYVYSPIEPSEEFKQYVKE